jgi:hypothetical protein
MAEDKDKTYPTLVVNGLAAPLIQELIEQGLIKIQHKNTIPEQLNKGSKTTTKKPKLKKPTLQQKNKK